MEKNNNNNLNDKSISNNNNILDISWKKDYSMFLNYNDNIINMLFIFVLIVLFLKIDF